AGFRHGSDRTRDGAAARAAGSHGNRLHGGGASPPLLGGERPGPHASRGVHAHLRRAVSEQLPVPRPSDQPADLRRKQDRPRRGGRQVSTGSGASAPARAPKPDRGRGPDGRRAGPRRAAAGRAPAAPGAHRPPGAGELGVVVQRWADRPAHRAGQLAGVVDAPDGARRAPGTGRAQARRARTRARGPGRRNGGGTLMKTRSVLCLMSLLATTACSKPPLPPTTTAGDLKIALALVPDPPSTGDNALLVTLTDASGKPVEGAQLAFQYDMPAMGAMPEMKGGGEPRSLGGGRYRIAYPLQMNGDWPPPLGIEAPGHPPARMRLKGSPPRQGLTVASGG